jgi:hypothetical protein
VRNRLLTDDDRSRAVQCAGRSAIFCVLPTAFLIATSGDRQVTWLRSLVASACIRVNGKKSSAIQTTAAKYSRPLANSRPPRIEFVQAKL